MNSTEIKDWMNFMVFSTTLCGNYEIWKNNPNISEIINLEKNPMCINLKNDYPYVENKVIQSIVLGFLLNVKYTISQYKTEDIYDENFNILENTNLEVD